MSKTVDCSTPIRWPLAIYLRIEVGLPFAFFPWPVSIVVGVAFAIVNEITERRYRDRLTFGFQVCTLVVSSFLNGISFAVGMAATGKFVHMRLKEIFIDYENIKAGISFAIAALLGMLFWRVLLLTIQRYLLPLAWKTKSP